MNQCCFDVCDSGPSMIIKTTLVNCFVFSVCFCSSQRCWGKVKYVGTKISWVNSTFQVGGVCVKLEFVCLSTLSIMVTRTWWLRNWFGQSIIIVWISKTHVYNWWKGRRQWTGENVWIGVCPRRSNVTMGIPCMIPGMQSVTFTRLNCFFWTVNQLLSWIETG